MWQLRFRFLELDRRRSHLLKNRFDWTRFAKRKLYLLSSVVPLEPAG